MTYRSTMYALVVEERFLQGQFLRPDLLPCHILSAAGQEVSQVTQVLRVTLQHCLQQQNKFKPCYTFQKSMLFITACKNHKRHFLFIHLLP